MFLQTWNLKSSLLKAAFCLVVNLQVGMITDHNGMSGFEFWLCSLFWHPAAVDTCGQQTMNQILTSNNWIPVTHLWDITAVLLITIFWANPSQAGTWRVNQQSRSQWLSPRSVSLFSFPLSLSQPYTSLKWCYHQHTKEGIWWSHSCQRLVKRNDARFQIMGSRKIQLCRGKTRWMFEIQISKPRETLAMRVLRAWQCGGLIRWTSTLEEK